MDWTPNFVHLSIVKALIAAQPEATFLWIGPPPYSGMDASLVLVTDDDGNVLQSQIQTGVAPTPRKRVFDG